MFQGFRKSACVFLLEVKQGRRLFFQMGACCNLIVKAVPIAQDSAGPYRLSGLKRAPRICYLWDKEQSCISRELGICRRAGGDGVHRTTLPIIYSRATRPADEDAWHRACEDCNRWLKQSHENIYARLGVCKQQIVNCSVNSFKGFALSRQHSLHLNLLLLIFAYACTSWWCFNVDFLLQESLIKPENLFFFFFLVIECWGNSDRKYNSVWI